MDEILKRDQNFVTVLGGITDNAAQNVVMLRVDPITKRLLVSATGIAGGTVTSISQGTGILLSPSPITTTGSVSLATSLQPAATLTGNALKFLRVNAGETAVEYATVSSGLTVGTTTIASGTTTRILYDNAGVLGEYTITGTGTVVAMQTNPTLSGFTMTDATNIVFDTTTGTKIGTATTQKLAFYNSTPIVKPTGDVTTALTNLGLVATPTINADTVASANEATDTTCFPLFITASGTQTLATKNNTSLTFNSNTAQLGATTFNAATGYQIAGAAATGVILRGNGTNYVASAFTMAAPGTSGNVLTSDGTNWTSASPAGGTPLVLRTTDFSVTTRFSETIVNGASNTPSVFGFALITGTSSGASISEVWRLAANNSSHVYDVAPVFTANFGAVTPPTTGQAFLGIGQITVDGTGHTFTEKHIGFKILCVAGVQTLYATQGDGSTETASSALTTLVNGDHVEVIAKVNGTAGPTSVDYYFAKNGAALSSATNLTTNLPAAAQNENSCQFSISNQSTTGNMKINMTSASYYRY